MLPVRSSSEQSPWAPGQRPGAHLLSSHPSGTLLFRPQMLEGAHGRWQRGPDRQTAVEEREQVIPDECQRWVTVTGDSDRLREDLGEGPSA